MAAVWGTSHGLGQGGSKLGHRLPRRLNPRSRPVSGIRLANWASKNSRSYGRRDQPLCLVRQSTADGVVLGDLELELPPLLRHRTTHTRPTARAMLRSRTAVPVVRGVWFRASSPTASGSSRWVWPMFCTSTATPCEQLHQVAADLISAGESLVFARRTVCVEPRHAIGIAPCMLCSIKQCKVQR